MNTHISKELALWLKERGCEIQTEMFYKLTTVGQWHEGNSLTLGGDGSIENQKQPSVDAFLMPSGMVTEEDLACGDTIRTYSWYDILVTHAKEFWLGGDSYRESCIIETIRLLQHGGTQEAEAYVREHSLFAKQESK